MHYLNFELSEYIDYTSALPPLIKHIVSPYN